MKVNVKAAIEAKTAEEISRQHLETITFITALGCEACRQIRGFGKVRLNRLVRGAYEEITDFYEHYGGAVEDGLNSEEIPTLYIGLRNQVKALDVPIEEIESCREPKPEFDGWRSNNDRMKRNVRWEDTQRMTRVIRSYWYSMIMHLWHQYGWGEKRLTRFYTFVQDRYYQTTESYLQCRDSTDGEADRTIKETIRLIKDLGVSV